MTITELESPFSRNMKKKVKAKWTVQAALDATKAVLQEEGFPEPDYEDDDPMPDYGETENANQQHETTFSNTTCINLEPEDDSQSQIMESNDAIQKLKDMDPNQLMNTIQRRRLKSMRCRSVMSKSWRSSLEDIVYEEPEPNDYYTIDDLQPREGTWTQKYVERQIRKRAPYTDEGNRQRTSPDEIGNKMEELPHRSGSAKQKSTAVCNNNNHSSYPTSACFQSQSESSRQHSALTPTSSNENMLQRRNRQQSRRSAYNRPRSVIRGDEIERKIFHNFAKIIDVDTQGRSNRASY